jgi:hypothetical protein
MGMGRGWRWREATLEGCGEARDGTDDAASPHSNLALVSPKSHARITCGITCAMFLVA